MKIVLDTNVIVSALLIPLSIPGEILFKVFERKLILVYDNRILLEYIDVLNREKFKLDKALVNLIIDFIKKEGAFFPSMTINTSFTDKNDKKFYEVFKSAEAQFLITGNLKHFPKEKGIVSPKEFISLFG